MSTSDIPRHDKVLIDDENDPHQPPRRIITLNLPGKRNALDLETMDALIDAITAAANGAVLITATPPAFCAGLDLSGILVASSPEAHLRKLVTLLVALSEHRHTTICYVQGAARAGGVALTCCADHVIAHPDATFMIPGERFYEPMASVLTPIIAARRNLSREETDALPGCLLSAEAAKSLRLIDTVSERQEEAVSDHLAVRKRRDLRPLTSAVLQEVDTRIGHAIVSGAVAPLIEHLRERFASPRLSRE